MNVRLLACGECGVLVEVADLAEVLALDGAIRPLVESRDDGWRTVVDLVPATRTLLVTVRTPKALEPVTRHILAVAADLDDIAAHPGETDTIDIGVVYDGPDLDDVAELTGLTVSEVVDAHTGTPWRVAFGGFAPGFSYLVDGDPRLEVPRRPEPRTEVPVGAVGLAGSFSGIYPRKSPGGWQLIGHTDAPLWDLDRTPPALLTPGAWVRFVALERP